MLSRSTWFLLALKTFMKKAHKQLNVICLHPLQLLVGIYLRQFGYLLETIHRGVSVCKVLQGSSFNLIGKREWDCIQMLEEGCNDVHMFKLLTSSMGNIFKGEKTIDTKT